MNVFVNGNNLHYLNEETRLRYIDINRRQIFGQYETDMLKEGLTGSFEMTDSGISPRGREAVDYMSDIFDLGKAFQCGYST